MRPFFRFCLGCLEFRKPRPSSIPLRGLKFGSIPAFFIATISNQAMSQSQVPSTAQTEKKQVSIESVFEPRQFTGANQKTISYRLLKPMGYEFGKKYPLVLFLHGAGERGSDNKSTLKHAAKDFAVEARRKEFPAYILIPQCPNDQKWSDVDWSASASSLPEKASESMANVKELIDEMVEHAGVDSSRIYITGLSMGGYGTWDAIARYPNFFAAAAPICGGGDVATVDRFKDLPIWVFHGAKDSVVKVERSRSMVEALKKIGSKVQYTEYPDLEHDSWTVTYSNPQFYTWLFAQRKSADTE